MSDSEEILSVKELEMTIGEVPRNAAQSITEEIYRYSSRLNELLPIVMTCSPDDREGEYVHNEHRRLRDVIQALNQQYIQVHNMQLEQSLLFPFHPRR
jgi:hypothetical protein